MANDFLRPPDGFIGEEETLVPPDGLIATAPRPQPSLPPLAPPDGLIDAPAQAASPPNVPRGTMPMSPDVGPPPGIVEPPQPGRAGRLFRKGLKGAGRFVQQAAQAYEPYRRSQLGAPRQLLGKGRELIGKGYEKGGEFVAETLAKEGLDPMVSAGLGTLISITPELIETAFFTEGVFKPIGKALNNFIKTKNIKVSLSPDDIREFRGLYAKERLTPEQYQALLEVPEEQMIRAWKTKTPIETEVRVPRFGKRVLKPAPRPAQPVAPPEQSPLAPRPAEPPKIPPPEQAVAPPVAEKPPGQGLIPQDVKPPSSVPGAAISDQSRAGSMIKELREGGVEPGGPIRTEGEYGPASGEVIGLFGRVSTNPEWFRKMGHKNKNQLIRALTKFERNEKLTPLQQEMVTEAFEMEARFERQEELGAPLSFPEELPVKPPKALDDKTALQFLREAKGDKELARKLALDQGFTIPRAESPPEDIYAGVTGVPKKPLFQRASEEVKEIMGKTAELGDEMLGAISTRLKNIHPSLKKAVRDFEFKHRQKALRDAEGVSDIIRASKRMNPRDRAIFDLARKNSDTTKINELSSKYGFDISKTRKVLDDVRARALEVGYDIGYREEYHPRIIKNPKKFIQHFQKDKESWSIIEDAISFQESKLGRILTNEEKASIINSMMRGYGQQISLSETGSMKARKIDRVTPELNQFYYDSDASLVRYVQQVNEAIEARRFFGKEATPAGRKVLVKGGEEVNEVQLNNLDDSIGAYILRLIQEGKIKPEQEETLRGILQARFGYKNTNPVIGLYKNLTYIDTLGSPISAITQLEDLGIAFYRSILDTPGSFIRAVMDKSKIKMKDLGIETIWEEMRENRKTSVILRKMFDITFFSKMDRIGKETTVNAIIDKYRRLAKSGNQEELVKRIEPVFEGETQSVINDLKGKEVTDNVLLLAFNELLDVQPVALSEMPQKYLESPAGRVFYTLKTFTLKRIDFIRNEAIQLMRTPGRRKEGIRNMLKLWGVLGVFGLGVDEMKNLILNRKTELSDKIVDNLLKPFGLTKWLLYKARREGIGTAVLMNIVPPVKAMDSLWKDITVNIPQGKKLKIPSSIPLGGKLYYWWFGKGADYSAKTKRRILKKEGRASSLFQDRGKGLFKPKPAGLFKKTERKRLFK